MIRITLLWFTFFHGLNILAQVDSEACLFKVDTLTQIRYCVVCEKMADPVGGTAVLLDSLTFNLVLQDEATIEGKIYVAFIVDENGTVTGERTLRNPGYTDLDRQVFVIIKKHKWIPAECKGKKVATLFMLPIKINYQ